MKNRELGYAGFQRLKVLSERFHSRDYRHGYVETQLRAFLADQVRALRGDKSQAEFGRLIGKPQSVVSRLEDEDYGKLSIQTLLDIAQKLDIAVLARFVSFEDFLIGTDDQSTEAVIPAPYDAARVDGLVERQSGSTNAEVTGMERNSLREGGTLGALFGNFANANTVLSRETEPLGVVHQYRRKEEGRNGNGPTDRISSSQHQLGAVI
jgi:hypothetical protein